MNTPPEFSRLIAVKGIISDKNKTEEIKTTEAECIALATRLGLKSLTGLKSKISMSYISDGNIIRIEGDIEVDVVQSCIVSLQDVSSKIEAHFDTCFTEDGKEIDENTEINIILEEEFPDIMVDGMIDLGELTTQYLSLELDPYPRALGVSLPAQITKSGENTKNCPFQVLKKIKPKKKE
ncbi:MAG: DUF177 domain-containing protein [Alphaproteobacteria bacterium]|nr:DUF177 domain-containing protein [Alphaproteobacteria bacterium]